MNVKSKEKEKSLNRGGASDKKPKGIGKNQYLKWYRDMLLMRKFEEKVGQLYLEQHFGGFCHLYIGQEAVVAGTASACLPGDKHITAYRDHAHPIVLGVHPKYVLAELYGKSTGLSKGKGGSMHMFHKEVNLMGGHGIVGAQIPMGTGIAFAEKYKETTNVCVCSFGDGAARQGALHESFNMAMMWKLPIVYIIENNHYAMGTSIERTSNVVDMAKLGLSYNMPGYTVDGMNVEKVHKAMKKALKYCREGLGPVLLNIETYRYKGHSMSDPQKYRSKEEVSSYQAQDCVIHAKDVLLKNKWVTTKRLEEIDKEIKIIITEAIEFAESSPEPKTTALYEDVYKGDYPFLKEYL